MAPSQNLHQRFQHLAKPSAGLGDLTPVPDGWVQPVLFSAEGWAARGLASWHIMAPSSWPGQAVLLKGSAWHGEPGAKGSTELVLVMDSATQLGHTQPIFFLVEAICQFQQCPHMICAHRFSASPPRFRMLRLRRLQVPLVILLPGLLKYVIF